jgi:hypothetical protein
VRWLPHAKLLQGHQARTLAWNWREWCLTDWCTWTHNFNLTRKRTTLKMAFGLSAWKRNNIKAMWSEFLGYTGWFNFNFLLFQPVSIILELLKCFPGILAPLWCRNRWCSYLWFWSRSSEVLDTSFRREHKMTYVNKINKNSLRSDAYSSRDASVCGNEISVKWQITIWRPLFRPVCASVSCPF